MQYVLLAYVLQIFCTAPCVAAQILKAEEFFGDLYQGWTQMGESMAILIPDSEFSTDLFFATPRMDQLTVFGKLSVVSLSGSMAHIYLNGKSIKVDMCIVHVTVLLSLFESFVILLFYKYLDLLEIAFRK